MSAAKIYWINTVIFTFDPIYIRFDLCQMVVDLTTLNILRMTRAMLINFCIVNTPRCQIRISVCKVKKCKKNELYNKIK